MLFFDPWRWRLKLEWTYVLRWVEILPPATKIVYLGRSYFTDQIKTCIMMAFVYTHPRYWETRLEIGISTRCESLGKPGKETSATTFHLQLLQYKSGPACDVTRPEKEVGPPKTATQISLGQRGPNNAVLSHIHGWVEGRWPNSYLLMAGAQDINGTYLFILLLICVTTYWFFLGAYARVQVSARGKDREKVSRRWNTGGERVSRFFANNPSSQRRKISWFSEIGLNVVYIFHCPLRVFCHRNLPLQSINVQYSQFSRSTEFTLKLPWWLRYIVRK